jgi:pimeloyl-ACP methyl ester carboxylesterase
MHANALKNWRQTLSGCCLMLLCAVNPASAAESALVTEEFHVPADEESIRLFVRNKRPADMSAYRAERTLLYVHGATYPSETAFDLQLSGLSWMEYIARQGWDVYLMDVRGYGASTRPREMDQPASENAPIVTTEVAVRDIAAVAAHIRERRRISKMVMMGWSWGTSTMAAYTAQNNDKVHKLVLYAPLWLRKTPSLTAQAGQLGAYRTVTVDAARKRWLTGVPENKLSSLIPADWFEQWAKATWATDPAGATENPPILRAPNGVVADVRNFWEKEKPLYDPANIRVPTLLIHAEWDADTPAYMSQALFPLLKNAPYKRYVVIGEGTHSVIMEKNRAQLFYEVQLFLNQEAGRLAP